jgi:hypothetical protein
MEEIGSLHQEHHLLMVIAEVLPTVATIESEMIDLLQVIQIIQAIIEIKAIVRVIFQEGLKMAELITETVVDLEMA